MTIDDFSITFNYDRDLWKNPASVETPFWVAIRDSEWQLIPNVEEKFKLIPEQQKETLWNMQFLALEVMQNMTLSELCDDIKQKILKYIDMVR